MTNVFHTLIARFLQIPEGQVERTIGLLNEGATIPFISRYRKEVTGGLDEVQIGAIKDQLDKLTELSKRKETILATIEEQGKKLVVVDIQQGTERPYYIAKKWT